MLRTPKRLGDGDHLIDIFFQRAADFQVHIQPERIGLVGKRLQLRGCHLAQAVFLAVQQMQAQTLQLVAIGEVQQVGRRDTAMGEVGQQGIGMGKQAHLPKAVEQLPGQCFSQ